MSNAVRQENKPQIAIVWMRSASAEELQFLSGFGGVRLYEKDAYDPRVGEDLPYFLSHKDALKWMLEHLGDPCQIDVCALARFGIEP